MYVEFNIADFIWQAEDFHRRRKDQATKRWTNVLGMHHGNWYVTDGEDTIEDILFAINTYILYHTIIIIVIIIICLLFIGVTCIRMVLCVVLLNYDQYASKLMTYYNMRMSDDIMTTL